MRIHLLSVPNTIAAPWYDTCPFTQKVLKMARMMTAQGHHVIHYGHERSEVDCAEHVTVTTVEDFERQYPPGLDPLRHGPPLLKETDQLWHTFTHNTINELHARKEQGDILLATFGGWHRPVAMHHPDLICIEPGIGYPNGAFADNKIFESYAIMHAYQTNEAATIPSNEFWYDAVIPIAFDPDQFIFREKKDDFLLFMGRMHKGKGLHTAIDIARRTKQRLIVAGYGALDDGIKIENSTYVTFVGAVTGRGKAQLLSKAKAVLCPSHFLEPFNAVQIEAQMSGTPVISTDWGAFAEYNPHGLTGYRCKSLEQFCYAATHTHELDPFAIRKWAERFSLEKIAPHYTDYFRTVSECYGGEGWFANREDRDTLKTASFGPFF